MAGDHAPGATVGDYREALAVNADKRLTAMMMGTPSGSMLFAVDRDHQLGDGPSTSFSSDALEGLASSLSTWTLTRIVRFYEETGEKVGPKHMRISITVELEP